MRPAIIALVLVCCAQLAVGENWPRFRGPTGQGTCAEKGFPTVWSIQTGQNILWKAELPKSDNPFSSPIVWDGRVFVTVSTFATRQHHVLCYDAETGRPLWDTIVAPGPWTLTDARGGYGAPTPCTDGQRLYVVFGSAVLACLDFDGKLLWRYDMQDTSYDVAIGGSPILYKDTVIYLGDQTKGKSRLWAFDKITGKLRYEQKRPEVGFAHSTPVPVNVGGKAQLLVAASDALQGIDPATGDVLWHFKTPGDSASPVCAGNVAYIDSGRGSPGVAVDVTGSGNVSRTHLKWKTKGIVPESLSSALIVGEELYRVQPSSLLKCFNFQTGRELYSRRLENVSTWCSPVSTADGLVYLASPGTSYVIKAGPRFEMVSKNDLGDPNHASAAFSNGRIYLKGMRCLYCIGSK